MFKEPDDNINTRRNHFKTVNNSNIELVSSVEEDLRILDRILDDIENLDEDKYVDTMIDCNNKNNNNNNSNKRNNGVNKVEEVEKLVVDKNKKLKTTEQVNMFLLYLFA